MTVRMRHPDSGGTYDAQPSQVPLLELTGWQTVEGEDLSDVEPLPAELQPFEGQPTFRMRHPDVEGDPVTAAESQVPFYRERGWVLVTDEEQEEVGLEGLTVPELRELAKARGISPIPATKPELLDALSVPAEQEHESPAEPASEEGEEG
jgi:hypothetical protein